MEATAGSVTKDSIADKSFRKIVEQAESLRPFVVESVESGKSLYEIERSVLDQVLAIGRHVIDATFLVQREGDLGATHTTVDGRELRRSADSQDRRLRTIFGQHEFQQYEYSTEAHRAIELRPIDARLGLYPRVGSYLFEKFTQLFCVETAFGQSARHFMAAFRQEVPVDTLEGIARRMGAAAETYADAMPTPVAADEGELLVATMDAKGVPLIPEHSTPVNAFETRRLRPGNRRMATLAGAYSVNRHMRRPEQMVAALFRDAPAAEPCRRPEPYGKHLAVHFSRDLPGRRGPRDLCGRNRGLLLAVGGSGIPSTVEATTGAVIRRRPWAVKSGRQPSARRPNRLLRHRTCVGLCLGGGGSVLCAREGALGLHAEAPVDHPAGRRQVGDSRTAAHGHRAQSPGRRPPPDHDHHHLPRSPP